MVPLKAQQGREEQREHHMCVKVNLDLELIRQLSHRGLILH
jgi:hypothetical protein